MVYHFSHAFEIRHDDGAPRSLCAINHQRSVLIPYGRHHKSIHGRENPADFVVRKSTTKTNSLIRTGELLEAGDIIRIFTLIAIDRQLDLHIFSQGSDGLNQHMYTFM